MTRQQAAAPRHVSAARIAVFVVFAMAGLNFGNWASRLPAVLESLQLTGSGLGMLLLVGSGGSVLALPLAGRMVDRWGSARIVATMATLMVGGLLIAVVAISLGSIPVTAVGLFLMGAGIGAWDVAMNVSGAAVEEASGRSIMAQFHAGWSLGSVAGAGIGALMAWRGVGLAIHLPSVLAISLIVVLISVRWFLPSPAAATGAADRTAATSEPRTRSAWAEGRTLLIGVMVLAGALTEGAANDWVAIAVEAELAPKLVDAAADPGRAAEISGSLGALSLGAFLTAMMLTRLLGNGLLDRFGRVPVLRGSSVVAVVGLALFALVPQFGLAIAGVVLWGCGAALGFPVGMSAAADDPVRAARRVSVVASIGYTAFLAAPPLLGLLADHIGYRHMLLLIAVPLIVGFVVADKARPLPGSQAAVRQSQRRGALTSTG